MVKRRTNTKMGDIILTVILCLVLIFAFMYSRILSRLCYKELSTVSDFKIENNKLVINGSAINLDSPFLLIREVSSNDEDLPSKSFNEISNSSITDLVNSLNSGRVNFSKKMNMIMYEVSNDDYMVYYSSKVKLRFSNLNDGYLLEINNSNQDGKNLYYNNDGKVSEEENEGWFSLIIKDGLNQIFVPNNVDINSLSRNVMDIIKQA